MKSASRVRRRLIIIAGVLVLFSLAGFFIAPLIVKSQLEKRLSAQLGRRVTVEKVRTNPYTLSVTLENFVIRESDGAGQFVGWQRLYVNAGAWASLWGEWVVSEIDLAGFQANVAVKPDASLNFSDILARLAPPNAPATPPGKPGRPLRVGRLQVSNARIAFSDASAQQPFATTFGPVTFALTEFRTVSERGAPYRFEAVTEAGEKFTWLGTLQATPLSSTGEFSVENILLPKYAPYYAHLLQADLTDGKLTVRGRYAVDLAEGARAARLHEGAVQLRGIKLLERATKSPVLELASIDVTGINADALTRKASVDSVALTDGHVRARRESDGTINLLTLLAPPAPAAPSTPSAPAPTKPAAPPEVTVGEFALKNFRVDVADQTTPRPVALSLENLQLSVRKLSLAKGAQMPLQLSFKVGPGTTRVDGNVGLSPLNADLKAEVAGFELAPLSPYVEQIVNARLTQGALTATLSTQSSMADGQRFVATATGDVRIEKLGVVDTAQNGELAGFGALGLRGLRASTSPALSVALQEITLERPYARVTVTPDKTINLTTLTREQPAPATPPATAPAEPSEPSPAPKIEVGKIVLVEGDARFTDRSLQPNVNLVVNQVSGTIGGFSSSGKKAELDLKAMVDGAGPIAITGTLDPLAAQKSADLKVDAKNVDLVPLSPYSGKFAGYELARGKLLLDVKMQMDGNQINSANVITLNQFTFGSPVPSPEATKLPVRLGVSLLKDREGKIVIDVPVQGRTDDPSFGVSRVVLRVITNLLTKAATSPFSLLGAAFGGGGEELAFQEFAPGSPNLKDSEQKKRETMIQALSNRPGLSLELQGSFDPAADGFALRRAKLADKVRQKIWQTRRLQDPSTPPLEQFVATPQQEADTLKQLFDEAFPPGTEFGMPLPKPPSVVKPPPPPSGFFKRVLAVITFQPQREAAKARRENERLAAEHAVAVDAAIANGRPLEEMQGRLAETIPVSDDDLRALAQARAQRVRDYFVNEGKIAAERFVVAKQPADTANERKGPRVFLALQ